jgi:5'-3' exonuclease
MSKPVRLLDGNNVFIVLYSSTQSVEALHRELLFLCEDCHPIWVFDGFDSRKYRRNIFEGYKAKRVKKVTDTGMFDLLRKFKEDLVYPKIEVPEVEADDMLYFLAHYYAKNPEKQVELYSTDGDFKILKHTCSNLSLPWVKSLANIPAKDVHLYKSLVGDSSDCIIGCKGFGEKTWDNLAEADKILLEKALKEKFPEAPVLETQKQALISANWQSISMAYQLVSFRTDLNYDQLLGKYLKAGGAK